MFNGIIYKLTSPDNDKYYIGSSKNSLNIRFSQHKSRYNNFVLGRGKNYTAFEILKYPDCKIELLEEVKYNNKDELLTKEKQYIKDNINDVINKNIPNRTLKEYYQDNKQKYKDYYSNNRDDKLKYQKEYNLKKIKNVRYQF
jgi:hypothetical protein